MADPIENKLVDKRVAHRYVRKGILDEKEYEKFLKTLPDLADRAVVVQASIEQDELDEDEGEDEDDLEPEAGEGGESAQP
jgi:hypothetical protein